MVSWPDFMLPPINLWNVPWQRFQNRTPPKGDTNVSRSAPPADKAETVQRLMRNR